MAQAQAIHAGRSFASRRTAIALILAAIGLAAAAAFAANAYIANEAQKVAAPLRTVWAAAKDIPAGALVGPADLTTVQLALPNEQAALFAVASEGATAPTGVSVQDLKKGRPIAVGDLLPVESAGSVAPLVPLTVTVGTQQQPVVGGLNFPLDRLLAPPPPVRAHDRIDIWASVTVLPASPNAPPTTSTQLVIGNAEIISFVGSAQSPQGYVLAVTIEQLDRFLFYGSSGAPMIVTVRSSRSN